MIATMIEALALQQFGELTTRQRRAIDIAASLSPVQDNGRWTVTSSDGTTVYRIKNGSCSCPDSYDCKHLFAIELTEMLYHELRRRLDFESVRRFDFEDFRKLVSKYESLVNSIVYQPPDDGLRYGLSLEAIGDDAIDRRRKGVVSKVRDLRAVKPWAARIIGLCWQFEFRREFQNGSKDYRDANKTGSRGVFLYYQLPPGVYEIHEILSYQKSKRFFCEIRNLRMREISKGELLKCLTANQTCNLN